MNEKIDESAHDGAGPGDAEGELHRIYALSLDMLGVADYKGYFKRLSASWETTLGFTLEELRAHPYLEFVHPDDRDRTIAEAGRISEGNTTIAFENRYRCKDGSYKWLEWTSAPYPEEELIYFAARDITRRKTLEQEVRESLTRLKAYTQEIERKNRLLEAEIAERHRAESTLLQQQEAIVAMSTPIIKAWDGVLVLPVIGIVDQTRATLIMEHLLAEIVDTGARFAILDLTGVDVVDDATASHLFHIAQAAGLLGSRCLLSGISPAVAQTMVEMDSPVQGFATFGELQDALRYALTRSGVAMSHRGHRPIR